MNKTEINKKIAIMLGFEVYGSKKNGFAWIYPKEYKHQASSTPQYTIPDFVGTLLKATNFIESLTIGKTNSLGKDFDSHPTEEDYKFLTTGTVTKI